MIAKQIKESLDTRQVIEYYGFKVNRQGFVSCPFHSEKTESLKVFKGSRGWHCFGCGQNGSVIDFVMKLFGIGLKQAITRLNYDFNLRLTNEKPDPKQIRKRKDRIKFEKLKKLAEEYWTIEFRIYYRQMHDNKPKNKGEELNDKFIEALQKLPQIAEKLGGDCYF